MKRMCIPELLAAILSFFSIAPTLGEDFSSQPQPPDDDHFVIEWSGANKNVGELLLNERKLIVALHNVGRLPTTTLEADDKEFSSPQALVRRGTPFLEWSDDVDNVVCDLNPEHCSRARLPAMNLDSEDVLSHVGGFAITPLGKSQWSLQPGDLIVVPNLAFQSSTTWQSFDIQVDKTNLRALYESDAMGCSILESTDTVFQFTGTIADFGKLAASDTNCVNKIARVNSLNWAALSFLKDGDNSERRSIDQKMFYDNVSNTTNELLAIENVSDAWTKLNQVSSDIYADLPSASLRKLQLPVLSLHTAIDIGPQLTYTNPDVSGSVAFNPSWLKELETVRPGAIVTSLGRVVDIDLVSLDNRDGVGTADALVGAEVMDIPVSAIGEKQIAAVLRPINAWTDGPGFLRDNEFPRAIVFVDDGVVPSHCVFAGGCTPAWVDRGALDNPTAFERDMFEKIKQELGRMAKEGKGHGLGVAAVATANPMSGALIGVDPRAKPVPFDLNLNTWPTERFRERAGALTEQLAGNFVVWNISGHTSRERITQVSKYLDEQADAAADGLPTAPYFVFAAGNVTNETEADDADTGDCSVYPACRTIGDKYKNVVTVVGAMLDAQGIPMLWKDHGSGMMTYTNPRFEIAAIAKDVVIPSVTTDGYYSVDGTSYAAPQVSAVLLLLRSQLMTAAPEIVVGRLVGCGRMSKALEGFVMGGLLDAECTLRFAQTQVAYQPKPGDDTPPLVARTLRPGKLLGVWTNDGNASSILPIRDEHEGVVSEFRWWPAPNRPSIAGFRQLADDPSKFNLTTWDEDGKISSRVRRQFSSTLKLEILFEGDDHATCIEAGQLLGYVPGAPPFASSEKDGISSDDSVCDFGPHG